MPSDTRQRPQPEEGPLDVVFEDHAVLVLNKPAGIVVHPTYKNTSGTLLNAVLWRLRERPDAQPGILTRLDKDTSGLVVVALTSALHAAMQRDGIAGRIRKEYLAVVSGVPDPPAGRIIMPLGRDTTDRRRVVVRRDGQHCETIYELVSRHGDRSLVRCELVTGRSHQIRVHLAEHGSPVIGDRVYGSSSLTAGSAPTDPMARQALHAWRVTLPHPVTRQTITCEAPLPADMRACLETDDRRPAIG